MIKVLKVPYFQLQCINCYSLLTHIHQQMQILCDFALPSYISNTQIPRAIRITAQPPRTIPKEEPNMEVKGFQPLVLGRVRKGRKKEGMEGGGTERKSNKRGVFPSHIKKINSGTSLAPQFQEPKKSNSYKSVSKRQAYDYTEKYFLFFLGRNKRSRVSTYKSA